MIGSEALERIARQEQTSVFPNIVREYAQHLFLTELYQLRGSEKLLFKGGTALRIVYNSTRFSEDLDFSLFGVLFPEAPKLVEDLFIGVLAKMEATGIRIELSNKSNPTSGGYIGVATVQADDYGPVNIEINVSFRNGRMVQGDVDSIANNFVPTYTLYHLPQADLVEEKIFGALKERKKPRDYYDLYFMLRKGMLSSDQKSRLSLVAAQIIKEARLIDFDAELRVFLPLNQQAIIRDLPRTLERELRNQLSFQ